MMERQNRTIICSVLFLDMVEYSRRAVAEQMLLRERFNALLREALKGVAQSDRVVLDTGDGAAITFLGDPEDALFMALTLRDSIATDPGLVEQKLGVRIGINLGPVKLVKDVNSRPNIIGDGINVAQRIMSFSKPGQVLVSRSYFEVVSRLSAEYSRLFSYEGARTDKHVREHEVYAVSGEHPIPSRTSELVRSPRFSTWGKPGRILAWLTGWLERPRVATTFVAMAIMAVGVVARENRPVAGPPIADRGGTAPLKVVLTESPAAAPVPAPIPVAAAKPPEIPAPAKEAGAPPMAAPVEDPVKNAPAGPAEPTKKSAAAKPAKAVPKKDLDSGLVPVALAVFPWGEVFVDGKQRGVSPPMRTIDLAPGKHEIEFRNTTFPSHVQTVEVKSGDQLTVRHKFQAGESK